MNSKAIMDENSKNNDEKKQNKKAETNKHEIEELEKHILDWIEELKFWESKDTIVAEDERRDLKNLIFNAKRRIKEIQSNTNSNKASLDDNTDETPKDIDSKTELGPKTDLGPKKAPGPKTDLGPKQDPDPKAGLNSNLPKDSWLQVMRDIFTDENMPEIKAKHNISENPVVRKGALALIPAALATSLIPGLNILVGGAAAVGTTIVTATLPAISRKITGRNKVVKQIREVINKLPPERFNLLAEGLTETNILDYMPNDVFLEAMQKEMECRSKEIKDKNDRKLEQAEQEQTQQIEKYNIIQQELKRTDLTEEQRKDLISESVSLYIDIENRDIRMDATKAETEKWNSQTTNIRRGRERKGHNYRGNVAGRFDGLFARKNTPSRDYVPALVQAADSERKILNSVDSVKKAEAKGEFIDYLNDNSKNKKVRRAAFNHDRSSGRIISDREDTRVQTIATTAGLAIAGIAGLAQQAKLVENAYNNYTIAENNAAKVESIKNAAQTLDGRNFSSGINAQYAQGHAAAEYATTVETNAYGGSVYQAADKANNSIIENVISKQGNDAKNAYEFFSKSGKIQKNIESFYKKFTEAAQNGRYNIGNFQNDHSFAKNIHTANGNGQDILSKIFESTSEVLKKIESANAEHAAKPVANFFHIFVPGIVFANKLIENRRLNKEKKFGKDQYKGKEEKDRDERN